MEQRTYQPNRRGGVVRRNDELHNRLYKKIEALTAVKHVTPAIQPAEYIYPQVVELHKLTARKPLVERVKPLDEYTAECDVSLIYQRKYNFNTVEVYCNGWLVVGLRAAYGQPLRKPQRFAAVVMHSDGKWFKTLTIEAGQLLEVGFSRG